MSRLTTKIKGALYPYRCYRINSLHNDMDGKGDYVVGGPINKLGQLEDLEEKLGIDLLDLYESIIKRSSDNIAISSYDATITVKIHNWEEKE